MIISAAEFLSLIESDDPTLKSRAISDEAEMHVWESMIEQHADYELIILQNNTIPIIILAKLAHSANWRTRHAVARKRKLGLDSIQLLSRDEEPRVRQAIAANQKTPIEILERLSKDAVPNVKQVAHYNLDMRKKQHR
ncbi:hypothetical protein QQ994_11820 [Pseudomonas asiatica]|uniref:Uncharacterized protein n=1 Tax=Pseudomonas putida TaxID=303 RepID=A0A1L5PPI8_PSEPU|nr:MULTISPECIES: hypothetical protein [Pseudomonas]APO82058.1 hypothetical protein BL240_11620 [Pseudomonas putida]WJD72520.1 hypothetical protein QQ994_11820 [Pseudomonas asiatica]